jgi:hypothetical protein
MPHWAPGKSKIPMTPQQIVMNCDLLEMEQLQKEPILEFTATGNLRPLQDHFHGRARAEHAVSR